MDVRVSCHPALTGAATRQVRLRRMLGRDELLDFSTSDTMQVLLERLLVPGPGRVADPTVLTLPEYDRVLAALYEALFGSQVALRLRCEACGEDFRLSFGLDELPSAQAGLPEGVQGPDAEGWFSTDAGARFRLPTLEDLRAVEGLDDDAAESELARRCVCSGDAVPDVERAMEAVGPRLDTEIETQCPSCGHPATTPFRLTEQLTSTLARERPLVLREVHTLARAYGWSREEILDLPREDRRMHVHLVLEDAGRSAR